MRRFGFYILVASLTFGIGSLIALNFYWNLNDDSSKALKTQITTPTFTEENPWERAWKIPVQSIQEKEVSTKPICTEANILPVWNQLINDKAFKDWEVSSRDSLDCAEMLDVKKIDLNRDGRKEILLRGKNFNLCSPVGNCAFWIYEKQGKNYRKLLYSTDFWEITGMGNQAKKSKTKGFLDILLKGHMTASDTTYETFKFDGKKYKRNNCLVNTYVRGTSSNPKWEFISCNEFFERWKEEN